MTVFGIRSELMLPTITRRSPRNFERLIQCRKRSVCRVLLSPKKTADDRFVGNK